jgi:sortase A
MRLVATLAGIGLILAGILVVSIPLYHVWQRGQADDKALQEWQSGGSSNLAGAVGDTHDVPAAAPACGSGQNSANYALVTFPSLTQYRYAGVAGEGTWDLLKERSMVHYQGTPAPGQSGNVIIAFHREPNFEHIDDLAVGATVDVQVRACKVWHYKVTERHQLDPSAVTQLNQTGGHELTLVTCTPWYVDTQRLVWRAELTGT